MGSNFRKEDLPKAGVSAFKMRVGYSVADQTPALQEFRWRHPHNRQHGPVERVDKYPGRYSELS